MAIKISRRLSTQRYMTNFCREIVLSNPLASRGPQFTYRRTHCQIQRAKEDNLGRLQCV